MQELIKISDEQVITIKVVKSIFNVSVSNNEINSDFNITGISVLPQFLEVKPNDIRSLILDKEQTKGGVVDIDSYTEKGIYFVNIRDYTKDEIQHLSKHITKKWLNEIWELLVKEPKPFSITLKDKKVKEIILEENSNQFKNESDLDNFCLKYGLSIKSFIEPANFSELDIKLKEIEARFDLEQFYARRYLFCSTLISQLKKRISEYTSKGNNIEPERLGLLNDWIKQMQQKLEVLRNFNDYYKLYDMPKSDKKIEIKDSTNINIVDANLVNSNINQETNIKTADNSKDKREETTGRTVWDIIIKHPFITSIVIFFFMALIFYGIADIKVVNGSLVVSLNNNKIEQLTSNDSQVEIQKWVGNWKIGWRYDKYFDNSDLFPLERDLEFKMVNGKLIGEYISNYNNKEVRTQLYDLMVNDHRLIGKYKGEYTYDKKSYESGEIEFLMFADKRYFIGKYKRTNPNTFTVDGNYRLWYGRK